MSSAQSRRVHRKIIMKKLYLALSIVLGSYAQGEHAIDIEPLDPIVFENNFYIGQVGFYLPQDNFLEITKDYFITNDQLGLKHLESDALKNVFQNTEDSSVIQIVNFIPDKQKRLEFTLRPVDGRDSRRAETYFACLQYLNESCVDDVISFEKVVRQNISDNRVLLDRLQFLVENSNHIKPIFAGTVLCHVFSFSNNFPLGSLYRAFVLSLSEAILMIHDGEIDKGLAQLVNARKRIDIAYEPESRPLLFDITGIISETQALDQVMNSLLNSGLLEKELNNPHLEKIIAPYTENAQLTIQKSLLFEIQDALWAQYRAYLMHPENTHDESIQLTDEDEYILLSYWQNDGVVLSPAFEMRLKELSALSSQNNWQTINELNRLNAQLEKIMADKAKLSINNIDIVALSGSSSDYSELVAVQNEYVKAVQAKDSLFKNHIDALKQDNNMLFIYLNNKYPSDQRINSMIEALKAMNEITQEGVIIDKNLYHRMLKEHNVWLDDFIQYEELMNRFKVRFVEQQNYHNLVYIKYLIMKNKISADKIPEFLSSLGDLAKNTVTHQPYYFDLQTHTLSTPLPDNKYLTGLIRSARWQNKEIQNYEVYIPNL